MPRMYSGAYLLPTPWLCPDTSLILESALAAGWERTGCARAVPALGTGGLSWPLRGEGRYGSVCAW